MPLQKPEVAVSQDVAGILVKKSERAAIRGPSKEPADMGPTRAIAGSVGVFRFVGVNMVQPVGSHPACGSVFQTAERDRRQRPLQPEWHLEAAMGEEAVVTEVDAHAEHVGADQGNDQPRPAEAPRQQSKQCQRMHHHDREQILPMHRDPADIPAGQAPESPSHGVGRGNRFCLKAARYWDRYRGRGLHRRPACDVEGTIRRGIFIIGLRGGSTRRWLRDRPRISSGRRSQSPQPAASPPGGSHHGPFSAAAGWAALSSTFCTMLFLPRWIFAYSLSETT